MATFWSDWQLWEKLTFLLACGIAVAITAGLVKVFTSYRQLRNDTVKDEHELGISETEDDASTPFGAAALRQGIETEGIWNSQTNTPDTSHETLLSTPAISQREQSRVPCRHEDPRLLQQQQQATTENDQPAPERISDDVTDRPYEQLTMASCSLFMLQHPEFAKALQDIETEYEAAKRDDASVQRPAQGTSAQDKHETIAQDSPDDTMALISRDSSDLSMLDRQRRSQVAETGQILYRNRSKAT